MDKLQEKYPELFTETLISFEFGEGWRQLVEEACEKMKGTGATFAQVKEKYGILTIYVNNASDELMEEIYKIENKSLKYCESCGSTENITTKGSWVKTLCQRCRDNL